MKRQFFLIILFLFIISISYSQKSKLDKFESEILNCIYQSYDSIEIDLKTELLNFEKYLIESGQLTDNTGKSYIHIFKSIEKNNKVPLVSSFEINNLTPENFQLFSKCFYSKKNDAELNDRESKIKEIYEIFQSNAQQLDLSTISEELLKILNEKDFENEFYRIYALHTFYFIADIELK